MKMIVSTVSVHSNVESADYPHRYHAVTRYNEDNVGIFNRCMHTYTSIFLSEVRTSVTAAKSLVYGVLLRSATCPVNNRGCAAYKKVNYGFRFPVVSGFRLSY
jgi:hypothetical protein